MEQRTPFLSLIGDICFYFILLFCAVLLVTELFMFKKAAINNTLISKDG